MEHGNALFCNIGVDFSRDSSGHRLPFQGGGEGRSLINPSFPRSLSHLLI